MPRKTAETTLEQQKLLMASYLKINNGMLKNIFVLDQHDLRFILRYCKVPHWSFIPKSLMFHKIIELGYPQKLFPRGPFLKGWTPENWASFCYLEDTDYVEYKPENKEDVRTSNMF